MFNVINLATGALVCISGTDMVATYPSGEAAAVSAKLLTDSTGVKHQPRRAVVDNEVWRARERSRFASGEYQRLPWDRYWDDNDAYCLRERQYNWFYNAREGSFPFLFAHASRKHPGKIAYTADDASGQADRQTVCTPGRFLTTFYGHMLRPVSVRDLATQFSAQYGDHKMLIADTRDEVIRVYENGPSSCMSHHAEQYGGHVHPVAVYGDSPDLAIAYLSIAIENDDGASAGERITARCVCWPEHKVHSTIYGDRERLEPHLRAAGYTRGSLCGARLPKIRNENGAGFIMPYIDNDPFLEDEGDYWVIVNDRSGACATNTNGLISEGRYCEHCEDYHHADRFTFIHDVDEEWCYRCTREDAFWCEHYEQHYSHDVMVRMESGEVWCQDAFDANGFVSDYDDGNYNSDDAVEVTNDSGDTVQWTRRQFRTYGRHCPHCENDVTREHVCSEAPDDVATTEATHVASETPTAPATAPEIAGGTIRPFAIGARVRRLANQHMAATTEATATVTGYRISEYLRGRELMTVQWDDTPARNGQRDGDYYPESFELCAPILEWLQAGDYVTIRGHASLSVYIPAGTYRVMEINTSRRDDTLSPLRQHAYIRCDLANDAYGLWIDERHITNWRTAAQHTIAA